MPKSMDCSGRFLRPFLAVLAQYPGFEEAAEPASALPLDLGGAVASAHDVIVRWESATRDSDLGLRAGRLTCIGTGGTLDYALLTAPNLRESVQLAQRYAKLYDEALEFAVVTEQDRVSIQIGSELPAPRAFTDFILSAWYRNHLLPHLDPGARVECCFRYPEPVSIALHQSVFEGAKLNFGAPFDGVSFETRLLECALTSADASLHDVHCKQLELLDESQQRSLARRVRRVLVAELQHRPSSNGVALRLRVSRRTLIRRLADEGTSFTSLLDDLRRQLATGLVLKGSLSPREIARSLGLSHAQAFHRCFKRWTGSTPRDYRETFARQRAGRAS